MHLAPIATSLAPRASAVKAWPGHGAAGTAGGAAASLDGA